MIFFFWYRQYVFFRRYGWNDFTTILLNLIYLAVILFYVYPLKFLFSVLTSYWSGIDFSPEMGEKNLAFLSSEEFPQLIILFSIGYLLVWTIVYLSYRHIRIGIYQKRNTGSIMERCHRTCIAGTFLDASIIGRQSLLYFDSCCDGY
jgi:hypothetical protein